VVSAAHRGANVIAPLHDATPALFALARPLQRSPSMLAITGMASLEQLEEAFAASSIEIRQAGFEAIGQQPAAL
jgi:aryl-alcohol dehydrogenase-like predicted oxidoreductase